MLFQIRRSPLSFSFCFENFPGLFVLVLTFTQSVCLSSFFRGNLVKTLASVVGLDVQFRECSRILTKPAAAKTNLEKPNPANVRVV